MIFGTFQSESFLVVDRHDFCFVCAFSFLHWIKSTASNLARLGSDIAWC